MGRKRGDVNCIPDSATSWDPAFFDLIFWSIKLDAVIISPICLTVLFGSSKSAGVNYELPFEPKVCSGLSFNPTTPLLPLEHKGAFGICSFLIKNIFQIQ